MIQIINLSEIGYSQRFGELLHETLEVLRDLYFENYGDYSDKSAVIGVIGKEFYVVWSKYPCKYNYGQIFSDKFYDILELVINQEVIN